MRLLIGPTRFREILENAGVARDERGFFVIENVHHVKVLSNPDNGGVYFSIPCDQSITFKDSEGKIQSLAGYLWQKQNPTA